MPTLKQVVTRSLVLVFLLQSAAPALGSFTFNVQQLQQGVLVTGNGALNISALAFKGTGNASAVVDANLGLFNMGLVSNNATGSAYSGISGPEQLGPGGPAIPTSGSGDSVGLAINIGVPSNLLVPAGYVSGAPLSDLDMFSFQTFGSLGLTPGTYLYTWGSGPTADSLTINIGVVPEPASAALIAAPVAIAMLRRRWRWLVR